MQCGVELANNISNGIFAHVSCYCEVLNSIRMSS
jgi:hypothetical protein